MKKVISFSLWGNDPKYTIGAIKNAELADQIYPGWEPWFYVGSSTDKSIVNSLKDRNSKVIEMNEEGDWNGMFWRFLPASHSDVGVMISRDTDSRLNLREAFAVNDWLKSDFQFHIMRDHPAHATQILGGMWGVKAPLLRDMDVLIEQYQKGNFWQVDQNFLREVIYKKVYQVAMVHDPFFEKKPFPTQRQNYEFVGDVFDENDIRHPQYWKDIQKLGQNI
jgi:protein O-GlcNAc transferase